MIRSYKRLKKCLEKKEALEVIRKAMPGVIAVDFDGCLFENCWPGIGKPNLKAIDELKTMQRMGTKLILWTCRSGEKLEAAVNACKEYGLEFNAVNDNIPENKEKFGGDCRKIYANEYWDDKAVTVRYEGGTDEIQSQ